MELNVHIPNSDYINNINSFDSDFLRLFENKFNTNIGKYTKNGYNLVMQFCGNSDIYKFKNNKKGYQENIKCPIYHYADYTLMPLK